MTTTTKEKAMTTTVVMPEPEDEFMETALIGCAAVKQFLNEVLDPGVLEEAANPDTLMGRKLKLMYQGAQAGNKASATAVRLISAQNHRDALEIARRRFMIEDEDPPKRLKASGE